MNSETRQKLLELFYDVLPDDEAVELRERMRSDPELASAFREAEQTAQLFAEAARLPTARVHVERLEKLETPEKRGAGLAVASLHPQRLARRALRSRRSLARTANWTVGFSAALLVLISLGGYFYHHEQLAKIAGEHLRLMITGPSSLQSGAGAEYTVTTTAIGGESLPAQVEVALLGPDSRPLKAYKETADQQGRVRVALPTDCPLPAKMQMKVAAWHGKSRAEAETSLAVEPERYETQLITDRAVYRPGDAVHFRSLTLSRFALTADHQFRLHFEVLDQEDRPVPGLAWDAISENGVGQGELVIPESLVSGQYTLVVASPDGGLRRQKRSFSVRSDRPARLKMELELSRDSYRPGDEVVAYFKAQRAEGGAAAQARLQTTATVDHKVVFQKEAQTGDAGTVPVRFRLPEKIDRGEAELVVAVDDGGVRESIAKTIPIHLGKIDVAFYPEGGQLAPDLEHRVYFTARDPLGRPVEVTGLLFGKRGESGRERRIAEVATTYEGMGVFSFTPHFGERYWLKITSPADTAVQQKPLEASGDQSVVLATAGGVFTPGEPLQFQIRAGKADLPLMAAAYCRGAQVGQQFLTTSAGGSADKAVAIPLDPSVGGVIRLTVYDYSASPPKPVAERLVYRRPTWKLNLDMEPHNGRHSPGQKAQFSLQISDEKGQPAAATLGVAVADDRLLRLAKDRAAAAPTYFLLTRQLESDDLENADFYLSDESQGKTQAAAALDLLLGTHEWQRSVAKSPGGVNSGTGEDESVRLAAMDTGRPPFVYDNIEQIRTKYEKSLAEYRAARTEALNTLTVASFFGGLGLVLVVAMLGLMRIVPGMHLWLPAVGATACCLIIGTMLMDPARLAPGRDTAVAFVCYQASEPVVKDSPVARSVKALKGEAAQRAPAAFDTQNARGGAAMEADSRKAPKGEAAQRAPAAFDTQNARGGAAMEADSSIAPPAQKKAKVAVAEARRAGLAKKAKKNESADIKSQDSLSETAAAESKSKQPRAQPAAPAARAKLAESGLREDGKKRDGEAGAIVPQPMQRRFAEPLGRSSGIGETRYWKPLLVAGPDGRASIQFNLPDALATYDVMVDAHGNGRLGAARYTIASRIPFRLEPKLPRVVSAGDRIELPVTVVNDTKDRLSAELRLEHGSLVKLEGAARRRWDLSGEQRGRQYFVLDVAGGRGDCQLTLHGTAAAVSDVAKLPLRVVPVGYPREVSYSGQLNGTQEIAVNLPDKWAPGSLEATFHAFPSMLADLQKGLDSILQEPPGCFEHELAANELNAMMMRYLLVQNVAEPETVRRVKDTLGSGYSRLSGYECKQGGFESFGSDQADEILTARGIVQLRTLQQIWDVDPAMIERTVHWLLGRRDDKGGFRHSPGAQGNIGLPADVRNAYIVWALSEAAEKGIDAEVKYTIKQAQQSDDPYVLALAAAAAANTQHNDDARTLLRKLAGRQANDGHLDSRHGSLTSSGGQFFQVETTALGALAWLKMAEFEAQADRAVQWIIGHRQGNGGFGSTQATVLALKALVQYAKTNRGTPNAGKLVVERDGAAIAQYNFTAGVREVITIDGLEAGLKPGENKLTINLTGNKMPYVLSVAYRTLEPESGEAPPLRLSTRLAKSNLRAGETVALAVEMAGAAEQAQPMAVAIIGLPAGLEPNTNQLAELKNAGTIDHYEIRAREIVFYWRSVASKQKRAITLDLLAAVPGKYVGPASRAYLYDMPEKKQWCDPLTVEIAREIP